MRVRIGYPGQEGTLYEDVEAVMVSTSRFVPEILLFQTGERWARLLEGRVVAATGGQETPKILSVVTDYEPRGYLQHFLVRITVNGMDEPIVLNNVVSLGRRDDGSVHAIRSGTEDGRTEQWISNAVISSALMPDVVVDDREPAVRSQAGVWSPPSLTINRHSPPPSAPDLGFFDGTPGHSGGGTILPTIQWLDFQLDTVTGDIVVPALPLRKIILKEPEQHYDYKFEWRGDQRRCKPCPGQQDTFCKECCPGTLDGECVFGFGDVMPDISKYIKTDIKRVPRLSPEESPPVDPSSVRKIVLKALGGVR